MCGSELQLVEDSGLMVSSTNHVGWLQLVVATMLVVAVSQIATIVAKELYYVEICFGIVSCCEACRSEGT